MSSSPLARGVHNIAYRVLCRSCRAKLNMKNPRTDDRRTQEQRESNLGNLRQLVIPCYIGDAASARDANRKREPSHGRIGEASAFAGWGHASKIKQCRSREPRRSANQRCGDPSLSLSCAHYSKRASGDGKREVRGRRPGRVLGDGLPPDCNGANTSKNILKELCRAMVSIYTPHVAEEM